MRSDVPAGWEIAQLGNVATVLLSNVDKKSKEGEPEVKLCNYMDVYSNDCITSAIDFMPATASHAQIEKFQLKLGDVMITKDSEDPTDIAIPSVVLEEFDEPVLCGYHLALLRPQKGVYGQFLAYALRSKDVNDQFVRGANGSTRFGLTSNLIHKARLPLPPLAEQRKIAAILTSVDEAIQATEAVIAQTRRVKEGLLQELLTKGIGHTRFKQTEIGEIPETWEVATASILLKSGVLLGLQDGNHGSQYPRTAEFGNEGIPYLAASGISPDGDIQWDNLPRLSVKRAGELRIAPARGGDVILTHNATVGRVTQIPGEIETVVLSTSTTFYRCDETRLKAMFLAAYFQSPLFQNQLRVIMSQTTRNQVPITAQRRLFVVVPPLNAQREITEIFTASNESIAVLCTELLRLRQLKSGLLQDLLTGRVRVKGG